MIFIFPCLVWLLSFAPPTGIYDSTGIRFDIDYLFQGRPGRDALLST